MRLDQYLVENNYFQTRTKAQEAIKQSAVLVDDKLITKPSFEIETLAKVTIIKEVHPYVSRGGLKLEAAIKAFNLNFKDKIVLDIGASTGGFTDCALAFGAKLVYAVDVGVNQLAESLLKRFDVISYEKTNILDVKSFPTSIDYIVMDVSFTTIEVIMPAILRFLTTDNALICLIKPQFEVGKRYLKNGIVKDRNLHVLVLEKVKKALEEAGLGLQKLIPSPILGGSGNKEFLALIKKGSSSQINILEVCK